MAVAIAIEMFASGCIQQECSSDSASALEANGEAEKPGGSSNGIGNNQACSVHEDCASDECVPAVYHEPGTTGVCWSDTFEGCVLVDFEQWVIEDMCGADELYVCQTALTPQMQANCTPPDGGAAPWSADFQCCAKPNIP